MAGPGHSRFPQKVRNHIMATTASNIRDWSSGTPFAPLLSECAKISIPMIVNRGGVGHAAMMLKNFWLAHPKCQPQDNRGGRQFLSATHAAEFASLIAGHVAAHPIPMRS
jgi:hypothetical protein